MSNKKSKVLVVAPILSFIWLLAGVLLAASFYPDYNHRTQFMSELGATDSPAGQWINYAVFLVVELFVLWFVWCAKRFVPENLLATVGLIAIAAYAVLLSVAAVNPCDFECRSSDPTSSHLIHVTSGMLAYLLGLVGLFAASKSLGNIKVLQGAKYGLLILGAGLLVGMLVSDNQAGLYQRLLEVIIYSWMTGIGYVLWSGQADAKD